MMSRLAAAVALLLNAATFAQAPNPFDAPAAPANGPLPLLDWMRPGMRLSYYVSRGESETWTTKLVPDKLGRWYDPANPAQRFSETDVLKMGGVGDVVNNGGYGVRQNDVVAVEPDGTIAIDAKRFSARPDLNALVLQPGSQGLLGSVEAGASLWIHPRKLAQVLADAEARGEPDPAAPQQVYRTTSDSPDGRRKIDAVRIVTFVDGSGHIQQTYDLATGVMLLESSITAKPGGPVLVDASGQRYQDRRGQVVTYARLVSMRQLNVPANATLPAFYQQQGRPFAWRGGCKMLTGRPDLDAQIPLSPMAYACRTILAGPRFAMVEFVDATPGAIPDSGTPNRRAVGAADVGNLVCSPALFNGLRPGATIDDDPVTRNKVVYNGTGPDGLAWIEEQGPAHRYAYGYEPQTGLMRQQSFTLGQTGLNYVFGLADR